jgi:hypothetical protein
MLLSFVLPLVLLPALCPPAAPAGSPEELLSTLKDVGREGEGNVEAARALRELTQADAKVLPTILRGLNDAGPVAANWIRSAFETIADREIRRGGKLPQRELETFIRDKTQNPRARRLAFEWLAKVDPSTADRFVPGMLDDPSPEFRRDAVARLIDRAGTLNADNRTEEAIQVFRQALRGAIDEDQVKAIVEPLDKLGHEVDLHRHFGFLCQWHVMGPFDNREKIGFDSAYPPESELDLDATYQGQLGEVRWTPLRTEDEYGIVDIAKSIKNYKGSVMYAVTEFTSASRQPVQIQLGTPNAWKLWLNGELLFAREEYHRGMALDQYRIDMVMQPGKNTLLLKICQNEQTESWAQRYQFQLRVCDPITGAAILSQPSMSGSQVDAERSSGLAAQGARK